jgi:transcriptional antiterminator
MSSNTLQNNLPRLELTSCVSNISTLRESDVDRNFISNVDFNYFTNNSFNDNQNIEQIISESDSFSALHSNIRSLSANHDHMTSMLSDLNCHFNIIGLTETKIRVGKSLVSNIRISFHFST